MSPSAPRAVVRRLTTGKENKATRWQRKGKPNYYAIYFLTGILKQSIFGLLIPEPYVKRSDKN